MSTRDDQLDRIFLALSDRTRRKILSLSAQKPMQVGELVAHFDMSFPAITKHLNVLEKAGLIERTKQGRMRICRMNPEPMEEVKNVVAYYQQFWMNNLDQLDDVLAEMQGDQNDS